MSHMVVQFISNYMILKNGTFKIGTIVQSKILKHTSFNLAPNDTKVCTNMVQYSSSPLATLTFPMIPTFPTYTDRYN